MKLFVTRLGSQVGLCCLSLLFLLLCTSSGVVVSSSDSIPATVTAPRGSRWAWNGASVDTLARLLAVGDFDGFNQVLAQGVSIQLGDLPSVSVPILGIFTITIDLKNVYCQNIDIGDILTSYSQQRNVDNNNNNNTVDELSLRTLVQPFSMDCYANYAFRGLYRGSGVLTLQSRNNKVDVELGFQSPSFDLHPPTQTVLNTCDANIAIYNLEFSSGLERIVVEIFEDDVSNMVENQAESGTYAK